LFDFEFRGSIEVKGKGEMKTFFLTNRKGQAPPYPKEQPQAIPAQPSQSQPAVQNDQVEEDDRSEKSSSGRKKKRSQSTKREEAESQVR
jgi:hypothetical protein